MLDIPDIYDRVDPALLYFKEIFRDQFYGNAWTCDRNIRRNMFRVYYLGNAYILKIIKYI